MDAPNGGSVSKTKRKTDTHNGGSVSKTKTDAWCDDAPFAGFTECNDPHIAELVQCSVRTRMGMHCRDFSDRCFCGEHLHLLDSYY